MVEKWSKALGLDIVMHSFLTTARLLKQLNLQYLVATCIAAGVANPFLCLAFHMSQGLPPWASPPQLQGRVRGPVGA